MFVNKHPALRLFVCRAPQAAAYLAASALCTLCALRLLRDAA